MNSRTIAAAPLPYDLKAEDLESFFGQLAKVSVPLVIVLFLNVDVVLGCVYFYSLYRLSVLELFK